MSNKPNDSQIAQQAAVQNETHAPLATQPSGRIDNQTAKDNQKHPETPYQPDQLELVPRSEKAILIGAVIGALALISASGLPERPVEFFITSLLSFLVLLVILFQAYIYKKQAHAMREGLGKTQELIEQNAGSVEAAQRQAKTAEDTLMHSRDSLMASERAYIAIRKIKLLRRTMRIDKNPVISLQIANGGRTPARNVSSSIVWKFNGRDHPDVLLSNYLPKSPGPLEIQGRIGSLFAGESDITKSFELPGVIDNPRWKEAHAGVISGAVPFYVLCHVAYTDFQDRNRAFQVIAFYDDQTQAFIECGSRELMFVQVDDTVTVKDTGGYAITSEEQ